MHTIDYSLERSGRRSAEQVEQVCEVTLLLKRERAAHPDRPTSGVGEIAKNKIESIELVRSNKEQLDFECWQ